MNDKVLKQDNVPKDDGKVKFKNLCKLFETARVPQSSFKYPVYRIVVLGTDMCGKTSLINSYVNNHNYKGPYNSTLTDRRPYIKAICPDKGSKNPSQFYVSIEDTVGSDCKEEMDLDETYFADIIANSDIDDQADYLSQFPFDQVRPVSGFVFCFEMGNEESYKTMKFWYEKVLQKEKDRLPNQKPRIISHKIIVGTKSDNIEPGKISELSDKYNKEWTSRALKFYDTSSYENTNIKEFWDELTREIHQDQMMQEFEQYYIEELKERMQKGEEDANEVDEELTGEIENKDQKKDGFCAKYMKKKKGQQNDEDLRPYNKEKDNIKEDLDEYLNDSEVVEAKRRNVQKKGFKTKNTEQKDQKKDKDCKVF